jgi:hypothetical protein
MAQHKCVLVIDNEILHVVIPYGGKLDFKVTWAIRSLIICQEIILIWLH